VPEPPSDEKPFKRIKTDKDRKAFLSAAGSWKGLFDLDQFLKDLGESRRTSRPPVELD
jgi:hypothetical protein